MSSAVAHRCHAISRQRTTTEKRCTSPSTINSYVLARRLAIFFQGRSRFSARECSLPVDHAFLGFLRTKTEIAIAAAIAIREKFGDGLAIAPTEIVVDGLGSKDEAPGETPPSE